MLDGSYKAPSTTLARVKGTCRLDRVVTVGGDCVVPVSASGDSGTGALASIACSQLGKHVDATALREHQPTPCTLKGSWTRLKDPRHGELRKAFPKLNQRCLVLRPLTPESGTLGGALIAMGFVLLGGAWFVMSGLRRS